MAVLPEWSEFSVGSPSTASNWTNPDCQPLTHIYHVTHLAAAHEVFAKGRLRAGLVFDKSKLNTHRILVNWLSPNSWAYGYRYGNVRFVFSWPDLIEGLRFYWVEAMSYGIKAPRILATANNYDGLLQPYDPTSGDGPWWYDQKSQQH